LDINEIHGLSHWKKVKDVGLYLVDCHWTIPSNYRFCGKELVGYFAFLHDSKRENDGRDPNHGLRAAKYARELQKKGLLHIEGSQLDDLCYARGLRIGENYCSFDNQFTKQLEAGFACENNFECKSNICASGSCASEGVIKKVFEWFKGIFGS